MTTKQIRDFDTMFGKMKGRGMRIRQPADGGTKRTYSLEEITSIIESGSSKEMSRLSRHFYLTNGLYRRIILYFSTMLLYEVMLSPKFTEKVPDKDAFLSNFYKALRFVDDMSIPKELVRIFTIMLIDGSYSGLIRPSSSGSILFADLPADYCRTRFRSPNDNQILEFNVRYFSSIQRDQKDILDTYPSSIVNFYKRYRAGKEKSPWYLCAEDEGVIFSCSLDGNATSSAPPFFIQIIPAITRLREYQDTDLEIAKEELSKLIINRIPLDSQNELAFEPEEIRATHEGIANMLKDNPHVDVITTFCDTTVASLGSHSEAVRNDLDNISKLVYNEAGVTKQIFNNDSALSIKLSVANDLSLVMSLLRPLQRWITWIINEKFTKNKPFSYEFVLLPVSYYNREEIYNLYIKGAQYGYSKFLAGSALGIKQSDLMALVTVENDFLDLGGRMVPLQSSHTTSGKDGAGAPKKDLDELTPKSIENRESE